MSQYNHIDTFSIYIGLPSISYSSPPEDPLLELTPEEMHLRKFCYEHNHEVFLRINKYEVKVYFEPDVLMLMEDRFLHDVKKFKRGNKDLRIDLMESTLLSLIFSRDKEVVKCKGKGSINGDFIFSKECVNTELDKFITSFYEMKHSVMECK